MAVVCASRISIYARTKTAFQHFGNAMVTMIVGTTATSMQMQAAKVKKLDITLLSSYSNFTVNNQIL